MIVVTGGSGKLGRACVKDLMDHGYKVTSVDMMPPPGQSNPPKPGDVVYSRADVTDFGQAMAALSMIDERVEKVTGVVHLAAIAAPGQATNHVTFSVNTISTYNIFEAARQLGIRNVVWASSETVYGIPYPKGPRYVPVDEEIESPETAYSLSKLMGEKMAEQFCRWDPKTKIVGLRFSNVQEPQDYEHFAGYHKDAAFPEVQPLDLYRRPRRRAGDPPLARSEAQGRARLRHRQYQLGDARRRTTRSSTRSSRRPGASARSSRPSR